MRMRRIVTCLVCFGLALSASGSNAGLGDLVKSKVRAMKGEPKAKAGAKAGAQAETGATASRMTPPVTPESLAKFKAALQIEKAEREKALKFLATLKTQEAWDQCRIQVQMSPEGMKVGQRMADIPDNTTMEARQKIMSEMADEIMKMAEAKCGPEPSKFNRDEMLRSTLAKGSDAFEKDDNTYFVWKEWVLAFCNYIEQLQNEPDGKEKIAKIKEDGVRVPGTGQGIYYVYTATEANELLERCAELVPLIQATL